MTEGQGTGSDVTGSDIIFPRFFLTILVAQYVPLRMTGSSMATGCDVTGSDVIRSEVADSPLGVFGYVRACCVVLQVVYHGFFCIFVIFSEIF